MNKIWFKIEFGCIWKKLNESDFKIKQRFVCLLKYGRPRLYIANKQVFLILYQGEVGKNYHLDTQK